MSVRDVIIIGAGPSGLATAIAAKHFGLDYLVLEKGSLVDAIARFPINMVFFTTPELLEIGGIPLTTPYEKPTRLEALRYYRKVVDTFQLQVSLFEEALSVDPPAFADGNPGGFGGASPFAITTRTSRGATKVREARHVVLSMGYYDQPVMLNIPGEDLPHVSHFYKEAHTYYRQRVVIVGGKNSAAEAALEIHRAGGHVTIVHRGAVFADSIKYWVKPDIENRVKEGTITAHFNTRVKEIRSTEVVVEMVPHEGSSQGFLTGVPHEGSSQGFLTGVPHEGSSQGFLTGVPHEGSSQGFLTGVPHEGSSQGFLTGVPHEGSKTIAADAVLLLTGYRADPEFMRHIGVQINPETLEPKYSAETYETNVPGLFVAGGQLAGKKTGTVFIENGRFHGQQIAKVIADRSLG